MIKKPCHGIAGLLAIIISGTSANGAVVMQRAADSHLAFQAELAEVVDLGGTGSKFAIFAGDTAPWLGGRNLGWGVLVATSGAKGNASSLGSTATYRLRFASAGDYQLFFRASVRTNAPIPSADSFYAFDGWNNSGTPVQENESGLNGSDFGWFVANSLGPITVRSTDLGRDLQFKIANREPNFVLDKLALVRTTATPDAAALDTWTSHIGTEPDVTLLKAAVAIPTTGHHFGNSVDLDGSLVIVCAIGDGGEDDDGTVFVFDRTTGELVSRFQDKSPEAVATGFRLAQFGRSVAISDGIAIVASGFHFDIENYQNHAFLYDALTGEHLTELLPTGTPEPVNNFSVDIEGDLAIVGATHTTDIDTDENTESGAAFLFRVPSGEQLGNLRAPGARINADFGAAVKLNGNLAIVGAPAAKHDGFGGAAYVFNTTTGALIAELLPESTNVFNKFGAAVALEGNLAIVGEPEGSGTGAVYAFNALTGEFLYKILPPGLIPGAQFGTSVSLSQGRLLVGAPANCGGAGGPKAYLFDATTGSLLAELARAGFDRGCFGSAVALDGIGAVIGSAFQTDGSAYFYQNLIPTPVSSGVFQEVDGIVAIEAEHFASRRGDTPHAWVETTERPGFAGTAAMAVGPNIGTTFSMSQAAAPTTPMLTYRVNLDSAGTYRCWLRGLGASGSDDSAYIGGNGAIQNTVAPPGDGTWRWKYATLSISAPGVQTINVWMREDGFFFDRLVLTKNTAFAPTGTGPAESPRE